MNFATIRCRRCGRMITTNALGRASHQRGSKCRPPSDPPRNLELEDPYLSIRNELLRGLLDSSLVKPLRRFK